MITFLDGILEEKQPARVVINVGGVGYEVLVPLSSFDRLPSEGRKARVLIYHHITEVSQVLFGFATDEERRMFTLLLGVSGIGPKIAVSALSGLSVRELKIALADGDVKRISSISGIGKKTAERIIVELRDKFSPGETLEALSGADHPPGDTRLRDAALALISLGYKQDEARKMIKALTLSADTSVEEMIRMALTGK
ncbi:MAG: holliday junction helicase RuvA [Verrucomicrobiota bacterium]|jgi:Holliday junction DNA helicase RuvA|nr:holliday junction helicase RuvA [Verrucomicrobiota bacterium]MDK2963318.1 holliday junction helicase RuvA [Verrucomicrobiota bacterium]